MNDIFDLPVRYKDKELLFPSQLQQFGYSHRFVVDVYGTEVFYERDEEGSYRAIVDLEQLVREITPQLLEAIAEGIEKIVR